MHTLKLAIRVIYCSYDNNCVRVRSNKDINITIAASLLAPGTQPSYLSKHIGQISAAGCVELYYPLTCFEEDNLIVLTEVHEASDALGKLHHVVNGVGDVDGTLLPHRFCKLKGQKDRGTVTNYSNKTDTFLCVKTVELHCLMSLRVYLHLVGVCLFRAVQSPRHPLQLLCGVLVGFHMRLDHTLGYTLCNRQEKRAIVLVGWSKAKPHTSVL